MLFKVTEAMVFMGWFSSISTYLFNIIWFSNIFIRVFSQSISDQPDHGFEKVYCYSSFGMALSADIHRFLFNFGLPVPFCVLIFDNIVAGFLIIILIYWAISDIIWKRKECKTNE